VGVPPRSPPGEDVLAVVSRLSCIAWPSRNRHLSTENAQHRKTDTSLLEAMTVGTFCIQADTACGCEWISPGVTGLVVPPHDVAAMSNAILKAVTDDALVDNAVQPNREVIRRRWSAEAVRPLVIKGYQSILAAAGAVRG